MLKNRYIKASLSVFLVLLALWVATPKVYIHALLQHDHSGVNTLPGTNVNSQSADDCDFEKYNKPAYFSIFKFICSFIPARPQRSSGNIHTAPGLSAVSFAVSLLRGPPVQ